LERRSRREGPEGSEAVGGRGSPVRNSAAATANNQAKGGTEKKKMRPAGASRTKRPPKVREKKTTAGLSARKSSEGRDQEKNDKKDVETEGTEGILEKGKGVHFRISTKRGDD